MAILGRRKHSRFLLAQPIEGNLRVREEVAIEEWTENEMVILSPEPCQANERLTIELQGDSRRRLKVKVRESRPAVVADGPVRHRLRLSIQHDAADTAHRRGSEL